MYSLELQILNGHVYHLSLTPGAEEVLWAPDSKAFFVNGGESAYGGFYVLVYVLGDEGPPRKLDITQAAQRDMVNSFPPCRALYHDPKLCHMMSANPEYNMSGIKWDKASSAIYVFAEVPPSSSYGGIMGQVLGYQLGLPDGRVLQKFSAQQVSRQWSSFMAWRMHIPDPPAYDQSR